MLVDEADLALCSMFIEYARRREIRESEKTTKKKNTFNLHIRGFVVHSLSSLHFELYNLNSFLIWNVFINGHEFVRSYQKLWEAFR